MLNRNFSPLWDLAKNFYFIRARGMSLYFHAFHYPTNRRWHDDTLCVLSHEGFMASSLYAFEIRWATITRPATRSKSRDNGFHNRPTMGVKERSRRASVDFHRQLLINRWNPRGVSATRNRLQISRGLRDTRSRKLFVTRASSFQEPLSLSLSLMFFFKTPCSLRFNNVLTQPSFCRLAVSLPLIKE